MSRALLESSSYICADACKRVLYNGVSEVFVRFPEQDRLSLRARFGVDDNSKVVAFVGNLVAVKNVTVLRPLFRAIRAGYDGALQFWIVGDGKLHDKVVPAMLADDMIDVRFWGNVPSGQMPSLMNCIDLLVLPSLNEGLPLVTVEALKCGAAVVGSDAGGIPEVIGHDCTVPLGPSFVEKWQPWPAACFLLMVAAVPETIAPETAAVTTAIVAAEGYFPMRWTGTRPQPPSLIL